MGRPRKTTNSRTGTRYRKQVQSAARATPERSRLEVVDAVCKRIEEGTPVTEAVALERVAKSTLQQWVATDPEVAIRVAYSRAVASESERKRLDTLIGTEARTAAVQLHKMERLQPDTWGPPKQKLEHDVRARLTKLTDEELLELAPQAISALRSGDDE